MNNYYYNADKIEINAYASTQENSNGSLVAAETYKWVNSMTAGNNTVAYIAYCQDLGFDKPTVFDGATAGTTGEGRQMEGLRVSSNVEGIEVSCAVHAQDIGWMEAVSDGTYAGTMNQNRQIEAIRLSLTGPNAGSYSLRYRAHIQGLGWMDWVTSGQDADTTGQGRQMEAIEIQLVPAN